MNHARDSCLDLQNLVKSEEKKKPINQIEHEKLSDMLDMTTLNSNSGNTEVKDEVVVPLIKRVRFSSKARQLCVYSYKSLPYHFKQKMWWQREDYQNFKRTIEIISQELETARENDWLLKSLNSHDIRPEDETKAGTDLNEDFVEKWWCQYGHSRRGLEHVCSAEEGRYRHHNVLMSRASTLAEQDRQWNEEKFDTCRLGMASSIYTSHARDLAQAMARADEDAVRSNFDTAKMKDFRFYIPSNYLNSYFEWEQTSLDSDSDEKKIEHE